MAMRRLLLSLGAAAVFLAAQDPPKPDEGGAIKVTFKYVLVPATVTDRNGETVNNLTSLDFRLFDNNKQQTITEDVASHPLSMVLVIQANGEVEKILPQIKRLGNLLEAQVIGESGEVAVVTFDHRVKHLLEFTSAPDKLGEALKKITPGSWSANLNDAMMEGVNMLKIRPKTQRRAILVISENRDKGSGMSVREVLSEAEFGNVIIYSVNISQILAKLSSQATPPRPNPVPLEGRANLHGEIATPTTDSQMNTGNWTPIFTELFHAAKTVFVAEPLKVYTQYTGGREYSFLDQKALDKAVSNIGAEIHSQYMLTYHPNNETDPGFHHIIVTVNRADLKVRARDGYYLAGQPQ